MKNATLRQLKVFESVARQLSFSRAAEELHLTQPAVSIQVGKLQEHAGQVLFEQLGKKIYLTPAGAEMLKASRLIIEQFQALDESMAQFKGVAGGRLSVAVISAGDYFFPGLLVEFLRRHEGVKLDFVVCNREELLGRLSENRTDLAVMVRPPTDAHTVHEAFAPHPYVLVGPAGHPLAGSRRVAPQRLLKEAFVVREKGSDTWHSMQEAFGELAPQLNVAMEIRSNETIKQAVIAGMGISFLSAHTVSRELRDGALVVLPVRGFPVQLNWYVVHRENKRLSPAGQAFKNFLLTEGAPLIQRILEGKPLRLP